MFGMGFTEILVIAIIAILFLGPDKLPDAMVEIAKFFRNTKNVIGTMKSSLEEEMNVKSMKDEALAYKKELLDATEKVKSATDIKGMAAKLTTLEDDSFGDDGFFDEPKKQAPVNKPEEVTLKKSDVTQTAKKPQEDVKNV
ncbi:MAG: twin arginine-targeting protein translocase TatB [Sulfurimonas sp. RIFOXYD12_FULL_33_39]|uniref:Sec-independent protein translocase protein TatB n=1 Tax=unclassified Sulfurimonas TaxID=2623549 RepID=UPI0008AB0BD2|nr:MULTISPECIES: Sec-independent protein translocase protein TatB [unclassified Sulfurimonas]OHE07652.1 MAG: twin arginine-targeting protein translocase TatB [Sulfurimonas sp. RIFCSPLOWO2_12_FULL_34_6]OHE10550.1 MAG: twin arginine-targeting protein translocase TatB [Sulfurimonas sp. RIFOXYD12_FULL_33_39]OHE15009.1 MAG: twin arginine-targeting protein translocase TatB [Sulfurimonas sp. RIFOXYD2_FULL_34_21]DAB27767.1 MAG TPA: twin-arginine translocase subunit TatB [Sulfurimonas sp. UBA10385]